MRHKRTIRLEGEDMERDDWAISVVSGPLLPPMAVLVIQEPETQAAHHHNAESLDELIKALQTAREEIRALQAAREGGGQ